APRRSVDRLLLLVFGRRARGLGLLEFLELTRDHALVAVGPDPADVPVAEPRDLGAALARLLEALGLLDLLGRLLGDHLLRVRKIGVIVVADRADGEAARTVAERADDAQQALPEAEEIARAHHPDLLFLGRIDHLVEETRDLRIAELLCLGRAAALVDAEMQDCVCRAGIEAARAG